MKNQTKKTVFREKIFSKINAPLYHNAHMYARHTQIKFNRKSRIKSKIVHFAFVDLHHFCETVNFTIKN